VQIFVTEDQIIGGGAQVFLSREHASGLDKNDY